MSKAREILDELNPIDEMSNAHQRYTGLLGILYFTVKAELKNQQALALGRVKLWSAGEWSSCTILPAKDGKHILQGKDKRVTAELERFVKANQDLLWDFWNTLKEEMDSHEVISKFKKV